MARKKKGESEKYLASLRKDKKPGISFGLSAAAESSATLSQIVDGLSSSESVFRFNCLRIVSQLAEDAPRLLDQHWERFSVMLTSPYSYKRACAVNVLVPLACSRGHSDELAEVVRAMKSILPSEGTVNSRYILQGLGRIAAAVPALRSAITEFLLTAVKPESPNHALLQSDVIEALGLCSQSESDIGRILSFVQLQLHSPSPRTKRAAREFLKRFGPGLSDPAASSK